MSEVVIAVDAMGGDDAPGVILDGVRRAVAESDVRILLVGDPDRLAQTPPGVEIVPATDRIDFADDPVAAVRGRPDSSIAIAARLVEQGRAGAVVSAGNSGATLAAGTLIVRRLDGVLRPALAVVLPGAVRPTVMIDAGANLDTTSEQLVQFARLGTTFAERVLGLDEATCGLLAIGEEPGKGERRMREAHVVLADTPGLRYRGSVEGRDLLTSAVDVIVADGMAGNIALKTAEGTAREAFRRVRAEACGPRARLGGLLLRPALRRVRDGLDPETYGGGYLLGVRGVVVIAHGAVGPRGVERACAFAATGIRAGLVERMRDAVAG
jgi:glycerol-3-phosphate acyltransferase PlsX